ncbi:class I SAM-dependent methyltransferase [Cellulomonas massiliensis]|uniref:class I SAM-dependent methyltransferase n=1 Tax=Cellulomonas massiliensis TaxID=1465811 RepID=UPI00031C2039|nr:class I SAM-dependent methyltransferase [Cellulomonas massiliensis]
MTDRSSLAGSALRLTKRAYVATMHGVGRGLTAVHALPSDPPPRTSRARHWLWSLRHVYDVPALAAMDVPWWTYDAIDAVDAWLAARPETRVFEYGSGASSLWLARRATSVHSVEHDAGFARWMEPEFARHANLTVEVVEAEPSAAPVVPSAKEGQGGLDFARYVATIDRVGGAFDLVVVDGRAREACLARAVEHLAPGGLVVLDNSRRARYRAAVAASGLAERRTTGLTPTLPYPEQTSLLRAR